MHTHTHTHTHRVKTYMSEEEIRRQKTAMSNIALAQHRCHETIEKSHELATTIVTRAHQIRETHEVSVQDHHNCSRRSKALNPEP